MTFTAQYQSKQQGAHGDNNAQKKEHAESTKLYSEFQYIVMCPLYAHDVEISVTSSIVIMKKTAESCTYNRIIPDHFTDCCPD